MSTITKPPNLQDLVNRIRNGDGILATDIDWQTSRRLLDSLGNRRLRFTYDFGSLEIMPTSRAHEIILWLVGRMLETWAAIMGVPLAIGGGMTFSRKDLDRDLAPDACYWIANEALVRGRMNLDFTRDPSPDLVIEVEVAQTVLDRLAILAALRVREVWRCAATEVRIGILQSDGQYLWGDQSLSFPTLPVAEVNRMLGLANAVAHTTIIEEFRLAALRHLSNTGTAADERQ